MEFEVEKDKEKITLFLERSGNAIMLIGRGHNGDEKSLMAFRNGGFYRSEDETELEGLDTDKKGRIKERK